MNKKDILFLIATIQSILFVYMIVLGIQFKIKRDGWLEEIRKSKE